MGAKPMTSASICAPAPQPLSRSGPKPRGIFAGDDGSASEPRERPEALENNAHVAISPEDGSASVEDSTDDDGDIGS